jgi:twitching motility protein PilT
MIRPDFIREVLQLAVDKGATDLHLKVPRPPILRIKGVIVPQDDWPTLTPDDIEILLKDITTEEQRIDYLRGLALDFAYAVPGLARFRVSALRQRGTISIVFRIVPSTVPTIDELGLPEIYKTLVLKPRGLILVTGTVGSGKSTTLAAMINYLNDTEARSIVTIEDPIEFLIPDNKCIILQQELGGDTKSFSKALSYVLRHDPDIIVLGELRDPETTMTAMTAAETGHLVIGTLHTVDAAQSIDRIIDVFPASQQRQIRLQLSQVLEAVLSQTLLPRIGGGQVAATEIMISTSVIKRLIREEKVYEIAQNIEMGKPEGMNTMDQAFALLVKNGVVTELDAMRKTSNPKRLKELIQTAATNNNYQNYATYDPNFRSNITDDERSDKKSKAGIDNNSPSSHTIKPSRTNI